MMLLVNVRVLNNIDSFMCQGNPDHLHNLNKRKGRGAFSGFYDFPKITSAFAWNEKRMG